MINNKFDFENTFPPLGHPEHHFNKYPNHPWLKTAEEIENWIIENCTLEKEAKCRKIDFREFGIEIYKDMTVSIDRKLSKTVNITREMCFIPIQFREVDFFSCCSNGLKSLIGVPILVNSIDVNDNNLDNLIGIREESTVKRLYLTNNNLNNVKEIKNLKNLETLSIFNNPIETLKDLPVMRRFDFLNMGWKGDAYELLMEIESVTMGIIINTEDFDGMNRIKLKNGAKSAIDMGWLKSEQEKRKKAIKLNEDLNNTLKKDSIDSIKRRKL